MSGVTLDAGELIALDRNDRRVVVPNRGAMHRGNLPFLGIMLASTLAFGCVSATPLQPGLLAPEQGGLFGRVEVFSMGEEVTPKCRVRFDDEQGHAKAKTNLDETGWVFLAVKSGPAYLFSVECEVERGKGKYKARGMRFEVQGGNRLAYFGHVKIDMRANPDGVALARYHGSTGPRKGRPRAGLSGRTRRRPALGLVSPTFLVVNRAPTTREFCEPGPPVCETDDTVHSRSYRRGRPDMPESQQINRFRAPRWWHIDC